MDEQLNLLIQLQEIDKTIRTLSDQKKKLPEALAGLEAKRSANQAELEKVKENLLTAQKNKRDKDQELEADAQKIEKLKTRSGEIKNNKEYQAVLKEIETAELEKKTIEDGILVLMEKIDAAARQITEAEERSKTEELAIQQEQKQVDADFAKLSEELGSVERARQELAARIQPQVFSHYQRLLNTKGGVAIAEARGEACSGCYMSIPPQIFVNVKKNQEIIDCPNCHRILYYKEAIVQKQG